MISIGYGTLISYKIAKKNRPLIAFFIADIAGLVIAAVIEKEVQDYIWPRLFFQYFPIFLRAS
jgi:hypothetical protein